MFNTTLALIHVFISIASCLAVFAYERSGKAQSDIRSAVYYALIMILFFPGVGLLIGLVILSAVRKGIKPGQGLLKDYEEYIAEKEGQLVYLKRLENTMQTVRREVSFEPFVDVIRGEDMRIKTRVIEKLSRAVSYESVQLLKFALADSSPEVRFYAAGALVKIENSINERIKMVSKEAGEHDLAKDHSALGDLYRFYAKTGLLEKTMSQRYLSLACAAYQKAVDIDTNQPDVIVRYAQTLIELKEYEKSRELLDRAAKLWPDNSEMCFMRSEVYFILGAYSRMSDMLSGVRRDEVNLRRKEVLEFWTAA
ncbi:MAG: tetratricopeptide repeat protein [Candidatus Omnitrophica bacterium]|nr:tetratricopeptide repeat protein [Candidatus Omnitrophota bacterium]